MVTEKFAYTARGGHFFTKFVSFQNAPLSKVFEHPSFQKLTNFSKKIPTFALPQFLLSYLISSINKIPKLKKKVFK